MPARVDFAANLSSHSLYTTYIQEPGGDLAPGTRVFAQRSVVTPVHFLHVDPNGNVGELEEQANLPGFPVVGRVAYRDDTEHAERLMSHWTVVNPQRFYWSSPLPTYQALRGYAARLEEKRDFPLTIEKLDGRDPPVYFVAVGYGLYGDALNRKPVRVVTQRFEVSLGCNVTSRVQATADGHTLEEADVEYALVDGIFVPTTYQLRKFHRHGGVQFERKVVFIDQVVNKLIEPSTFTFAHLGLKDGERVIDRIDGGLWIYKQGHLIDPNASIGAATNSTPRSSLATILWPPSGGTSRSAKSRFPLIILLSVGLVGTIVAIALLRRWRFRHQRHRNATTGSTVDPKT
jgi:hypothetical protein